jgi:hypothetical protein
MLWPITNTAAEVVRLVIVGTALMMVAAAKPKALT